MDNMIISGVRIYFPHDEELPKVFQDIKTYAVVSNNFPGYMILEYRNGEWLPVTARLFKESAHAISAIIKISQMTWC